MLAELHIENLAVIPDASIEFKPGLNVITGETGAGKTLLAHAISLLLGKRADSSMIRPGAEEAVVEAVFWIDGDVARIAADVEMAPGEALAVKRKVTRDGRTRAYVGGRGATVSLLRELTAGMLAFSAQHEHRSLMMAGQQLEIVDLYAGRGHIDLRDEYYLLFEQRRDMSERLMEMERDAASRIRERELLEFQAVEIEAANIRPSEDEELVAERKRLLNASDIKETAGSLGQALAGNGESEGIKDALSALLPALREMAGIDPGFEKLAGRLEDCIFELEDLGREAGNYAEGVTVDPERLADVEARLDILDRLKRKYGSSLDEVLGLASAAAAKISAIDDDNRDEQSLREKLKETDAQLVELAFKLRRQRTEAAARLERDTAENLADLAFSDCDFNIAISPVEGDSSLAVEDLERTGADSVEFMVRLNPGMPEAPLKDTASGGELSRIMLAIKSAISGESDVATLVFDEIDAGIGGETAIMVGQKLKRLAEASQVICITHLPQIACFADAHFAVTKRSRARDGVTQTVVKPVSGSGIVDELCRMMGSDPSDASARGQAENLLGKAASC